MASTEDPPPVRWRLHLSSPPEKDFESLTTDAGRSKFWAELAVATEGHVDLRNHDPHRTWKQRYADN